MKKQGNKEIKNKKQDNVNTNGKEDLPGYPHYPESEDIMNTPEQKLSIDIENPEKPLVVDAKTNEAIDDDLELQEGNSADVTREELEALGDLPVDITASDLVVPGAELDDAQEEIGNEDEENNFYSRADN
jgi:hypothetical protein